MEDKPYAIIWPNGLFIAVDHSGTELDMVFLTHQEFDDIVEQVRKERNDLNSGTTE